MDLLFCISLGVRVHPNLVDFVAIAFRHETVDVSFVIAASDEQTLLHLDVVLDEDLLELLRFS